MQVGTIIWVSTVIFSIYTIRSSKSGRNYPKVSQFLSTLHKLKNTLATAENLMLKFYGIKPPDNI